MAMPHSLHERTVGRKPAARSLILILALFHLYPAWPGFTATANHKVVERSCGTSNSKQTGASFSEGLHHRGAQRRLASPTTTRKVAVAQIAVVTDEQVPEAHRGLHSSLYGENSKDAAADVHGTATATNLPLHTLSQKMDGSELVDLQAWLQDVKSQFDGDALLLPAVGLYALYDSSDSSGVPWRVGFSRRVHFDLARLDCPRALFVRIRLLGKERRMWTRARLEEARISWQAELGGAGAAEEHQSLSALDEPSQDSLGKAEKEAFQERKWKLQIAMGKRMEEDPDSADANQRQEQLRQAVEADDWSGVISRQTEMTRADTTGSGAITSPFDASSTSDAAYSTDGISKELNMQSVNAVLEAVRPILVADGGDVEVVGVDTQRGIVTIAMLGACTSCPAAPSTIASGIERCLVEHFGDDAITQVVRVDAGADALSDDGMSLAVRGHLGDLKAALEGEGAHAKLVHDADGQYRVCVTGSEMLFQLVKSSLTYRFPEFVGRLKVEKVAVVS
mmetsp:Transcript_48668/g.89737  ORF Transcript_48668/g.89737 Transcript_48668/m.89737 type:complete len:508 (-) Transcript_48668:123-1646(-)